MPQSRPEKTGNVVTPTGSARAIPAFRRSFFYFYYFGDIQGSVASQVTGE